MLHICKAVNLRIREVGYHARRGSPAGLIGQGASRIPFINGGEGSCEDTLFSDFGAEDLIEACGALRADKFSFLSFLV